MFDAFLAIAVSFVGYSVRNISQACQKIGLTLWSKNRLKGSVIWILGTLGTTGSLFIIMYAVSIGNVALVGAMAGSGLVSLSVFSWLVMKEEIGGREIIGISLILIAAVLLGMFRRDDSAGPILIYALFLTFFVVVLTYSLACLVFKKNPRVIGLVIAGLSGCLMGFVTQFQKVSLSEIGRASALFPVDSGFVRVASNPYTLIWIFLSMAALVILQFAYKRDRAIRLIPAFTANYLFIPVVGGIICFGERLHPLQWVGVALILIGVIVITSGKSRSIGMVKSLRKA